MSGFDTPIPMAIICGWAILVIAVVAWGHLRFRKVLSLPYQLLLITLRLAAATLLLLLLLQPYVSVSTPDRNAFQVALLADCSHSMETQDCNQGDQRFRVLRRAVAADGSESLRRRLARAYRVRTFLFSEELHEVRGGPRPDGSRASSGGRPPPAGGQEFGLLPGRTALGDVLRECLQEFSSVSLGAVLLLSDGHVNHGEPAPEICKTFRGRRIPVSCIGIGELRSPGDVRVSFAADSLSVVKGTPYALRVRVTNTLPKPVRTEVMLSDGATTLGRRDVTLDPEHGEATFEIRVTPWRAGFQTVAARVTPVPGDNRPDTDVDYAGVQVKEPDVFRILYFGGRLNWEYKFLKLLVDASEQLSMAAVIRTGKSAYYTAGLPDAETGKGFPKSRSVINEFDAVLLDTRAMPLLSPETTACLQNFVEHRGGGLLCFGPMAPTPDAFGPFLPVLAGQLFAPARNARLEPSSSFIFGKDPSGILHSPQGLPLSVREPSFLIRELKRGARPAVFVRNTGEVVLAAQSYGSGRVAALGFENTWRWRMESSVGAETHDAFWNALLVWLASTSKKRIDPVCAGRKAGVGEQVPLDVTVLGTDFRPAPDARIACEVTAPSGGSQEVFLNPSAESAGRYTGLFFPEEPGEHTAAYRIKLPAEEFAHQTHFLARHIGVEAENVQYREDVLRDIARITAGRFWRYTDLDSIAHVPLSPDVPLKTERLAWSRSWVMFAVLAALASLDWYCRRRVGLK